MNWVLITIAAAAFQTTRTAAQRRLRALLSVSGAGFVRYAYGAPLALVSVAALVAGPERSLPSVPLRFWPVVAGAGIAQIIGTVFLIRAFDARDFVIGTVYSKTEVVQVALFSLVFLGEPVSVLGWLAAGICLSGVVVLAVKGSVVATLRTSADRAALLGAAAGGCFGLAAVGIRAASKSLGDHPAVIRALVTLAVMNTIQTIVHGGYLFVRERDQLVQAFRVWRSSSIVGVLSVCGSGCWALAMTLQNAAIVRTLGQVELLLTFAIARFWLHERQTRREYAASAVVILGVVLMVWKG